MLQSQVNLDHRLAELHQLADDLRLAHAVGGTDKSGRSLGAAIRAIIGSSAPARRARLAAR